MRKKRFTKMLALCLASAMSLSACGNDGNKSTEGSEKNVSSSEVTVQTSEQEKVLNYWDMLNDVSDTSELPDWTGDPLEVTVWLAGGTDSLVGEISDTNVTFKEFERVTGVSFNVEDSFSNGGDSIDAKLPKVIASGELPTIVAGWDIDAQMKELWENGYLADLTSYIENGDLDQVLELCPTEEMEDLIWYKMHDDSGSYYLLPQVTMAKFYNATGYYPDCYDMEEYNRVNSSPMTAGGLSAVGGMAVREDILLALYPDALTAEEIEQIYIEEGEYTREQIFDIPLKSSEDVMQFLRDIKKLLDEGDFKGYDGKEMEVTYGPYSGTDNWEWMTTLPKLTHGFSTGVDYFCVADLESKDENNLLEWAFSNDEYVDFMRDLNALVNEDVIAQNSLVDNAATFEEKYVNGHYAVTYGTHSPMIQELSRDTEARYRTVWVDVPTDMTFTGFGTLGNVSYFGIFQKDLTDEQLDQLVHAINYLNSEVGMKNFLWGPASAGLFTEDADGNRSYVDAELAECMEKNVDNGANVKYGLLNRSVGNRIFEGLPIFRECRFETPRYLFKKNAERQWNTAWSQYCAGAVAEHAYAGNAIEIGAQCKIYSLGSSVEGLAEFWAARSGFEQQMTKTIVASPDKFDAELEKLFQYAEDNGLTDKTLQEFNDMFVERNRTYLEAYGIIE